MMTSRVHIINLYRTALFGIEFWMEIGTSFKQQRLIRESLATSRHTQREQDVSVMPVCERFLSHTFPTLMALSSCCTEK